MSTLLTWIKLKQKRSLFWWMKYYWNNILMSLSLRKEKEDNSWKGIKISHSVIPEKWNKENVFPYLNEEYKDMKFDGITLNHKI